MHLILLLRKFLLYDSCDIIGVNFAGPACVHECVDDFIDLSENEIAPECLRLIPVGLARLHQALPIAIHDNTLKIALVDPLDLRAAEDLRFALGKNVHVVIAPAKILGNLRKAFHAEVTDRIVGEIPKELTSHPIPQIERLVAA